MMRKKRPLLLAFCIPVAVMLAVIVYKRIYPFGDRCFLRVDMYNQYVPFFMEFGRKLREGGSLFFSWRAGLGANFPAIYAYYLASPMNWLLFLCPEDYVIEFMTVLVVVKTGLCGLSFAWYLERHYGTDGYGMIRKHITYSQSGDCGYGITIFSVFYALSGFMAAYNWNIMWLDCIFIAPVIIFGLEKLVYRDRPFLYCLSLAASIWTNYYISIPICIFLVCYLAILFVSPAPPSVAPLPAHWKKKGFVRFVSYSLLAAGLSGAVLLPGTLALRSTRFDQICFPDRIKCYFPSWEVLARHCMNVGTEIRTGHWPNIYCGVFVLLLIPLYIGCRRIRGRDKLPRLAMLLFFLLSFSVNIPDFFWHGLNFPDNLPARQSFLYIFLVLTMSYEAFYQYRKEGGFPTFSLLLSTVGAMAFLFLCRCFWENEDVAAENIVLTGVYVLLYGLLFFCMGKYGPHGKRRSAGCGGMERGTVFLLFCVVVAEAALNTAVTSVMTTSRSGYLEEIRTSQRLLAAVEETGSNPGRIEEQDRMTKNDGMLGGYATATFFSSTVNESMAYFYRRMGMSSSKVFYCYDGATPLSSALLSVGYTLSDSPALTDDFHVLLRVEGETYLYQNRCRLPAGFVVDTDLEERWTIGEGSPAEVQNSLADALGIREPLFYHIPVISGNGKASLEIEENGYYYVYPEGCSTRDMAAEINGRERIYEKVYYPHFLDLGWCNAGETVNLTQSGTKRNEKNRLEVSACRLSVSTLEEMLRRLSRYPMEITEITDRSLSGRVDTAQAGLLVTAIPGEAGWKASVDGEPAAVRLFGGALLSVEVPAGIHEVTFLYTPPGVYGGLFLSGLSALLLFLLRLCRKPLHDRQPVP